MVVLYLKLCSDEIDRHGHPTGQNASVKIIAAFRGEFFILVTEFRPDRAG